MAVRKKATRTGWSVVEAKARLDEIMDEVETEGPQTLLENGNERALIVPMNEWDTNQRRRGTLAEFFHNSPLRGVEIDLTRHPDTVADLREIEF